MISISSKARFLVILFGFATVGANPAASWAFSPEAETDSALLTVDHVEVKTIDEDQASTEKAVQTYLSSSNLESANPLLHGNQDPQTLSSYQTLDFDVGSLVGLGKAAWDVISSNKPVANVQTDKVDVLPEGFRTWTDLQGWQAPKSRVYEVSLKNVFGMKLVGFSYRVLSTYGGNRNGKGRFLANVTVIPGDIYVIWGFNLSLNATIASITNAGTSDDPMAAVTVLVQWKATSAVSTNQASYSYYLRGDGSYQDL